MPAYHRPLHHHPTPWRYLDPKRFISDPADWEVVEQASTYRRIIVYRLRGDVQILNNLLAISALTGNKQVHTGVSLLLNLSTISRVSHCSDTSCRESGNSSCARTLELMRLSELFPSMATRTENSPPSCSPGAWVKHAGHWHARRLEELCLSALSIRASTRRQISRYTLYTSIN